MKSKYFNSYFVFVCVILFLWQFSFSQTLLGSGSWGLHQYKVYEYPDQSWDAANAQVTSPWHLATLTSLAEHNAVAGILDGLSLTDEFWIGGFQSNPNAAPDQTWTWVTGESWSFTNWDGGEPNDNTGPGSESHLGIGGAWMSGWLWNDEGAFGNIQGYVTELTPIAIQIDIKPGSYPNCINLGSNGFVPVAILGSAIFDVHTVDPSTLTLAGANARQNGKSGRIGAIEDVNEDGFFDLVLHFPVKALSLTPTDTDAQLLGYLLNGVPIYGTDDICIVPPDLSKKAATPLPTEFNLAPNYPNPFNPSTRINYSIPELSYVVIKVFNIKGEIITTLVDGQQYEGVHSVTWYGTDEIGKIVPAGIYFCRMQAGDFQQTIRMMFLK